MFLDGRVFRDVNAADVLVGWGSKQSSLHTSILAQQRGLSFWALEDGFLRSFGTGDKFPPLSLVVDEFGIYYDSTRPCALTNLLNVEPNILSGIEVLVQQALHYLLMHQLSKYNHAPELPLKALRQYDTRRVLVVDQTAGDMSVTLGAATPETFSVMLNAALIENPGATVYVKTHPEVTSGRKSGYLTHVKPNKHTVVLRNAVSPMSLLSQMDKVYVVTSTMGFEALLAGKPVVCFGVPWYAGWGVTDDRYKDSPVWSRRTRRRSVLELFAAAYIHYTRYLNPVTHKRGTILDMVEWLVRQKEMATRMHGAERSGRVWGVGFRRWKAANLKPMLGLHRELVQFVPNTSWLNFFSAKPGETLVCWGAIPPPSLVRSRTKNNSNSYI